MNELKERLVELETRFTHQARQIEELNAEVIECHQRIARLERESRRVTEMLGTLAPDQTESPDE